jgi:hypothetical protein
MPQLVEKHDAEPLCPHCDEALRSVWFRELKSTFGRRSVYFCSSCRKCLGISHRKGFWMG